MNWRRVILIFFAVVIALVGCGTWFFSYKWDQAQEKALANFERSRNSDRIGVLVYVPENSVETVHLIGGAVSREYDRFKESIDMIGYQSVGSSSFTAGNEYPFTFDALGIEIPDSQYTGYFEITARVRQSEDRYYAPDTIAKAENALDAIKKRLEAEWGDFAIIEFKQHNVGSSHNAQEEDAGYSLIPKQ